MRRAISLIVLAAIGALQMIVAYPAAAAGTPLLAIGIDVVEANANTATYRINARNVGSARAEKVRVSLPVPKNTTFESSSPAASPVDGAESPPTCDNAALREPEGVTCQWYVGDANAGSTHHITVILNLLSASTSYTVQAIASISGINPGTGASAAPAPPANSDSDSSLKRNRLPTIDTSVGHLEPPNTNHGACPSLTTRGDGSFTAFVDVTLPAMEQIWASELEISVVATDNTSGNPGTLAIYPVTSGDWTEGGGGCGADTQGSDKDARTGTFPSSSTTPSASWSVTETGKLRTNVFANLDTPGERAAFQGWELKNRSGIGTIDIASEEAEGTSLDPLLTVVFTTAETARCIDVDPEFAVDFPTAEQIVTALVTDGAGTPAPTATSSKVVSGDVDGCNGTPVTGQAVRWLVEGFIPPDERETPDVYISNQNGVFVPKSVTPLEAVPDTIQTTTNQAGTTFIGIRLANSQVWEGQNRISGFSMGGTDTPEPETCNTQQLLTNQCPNGESQQEDDVALQWSPAGAPPPETESPKPSQSPTTSPTQSPTSTASASSTSRPSGTPTGSPSGSVSATGLSPVTLGLTSSKGKAQAFSEVILSGTLSSDNPSCAQPGTLVQISKRDAGSTEFERLASVDTGVGGFFEHKVVPEENTAYVASIDGHDVCEQGISSPITVLVSPKVTIKSTATKVPLGRRFWVTGKVLPEHQLTPVTLWRKKGPGRFDRIGKAFLDAASRYSFAVKYTWKRPKVVLLVRWKATDADHISAKSPVLRIERA